ncbi:unnamed protein product [Closterium sp. Naga37s-1]|nr:unnamed protein product [Closterium sp. Naga37s-1]
MDTATNQGARRGSPRQPAEKVSPAALEHPRTFESPARVSPRQVAEKVSPAARKGDPQPPLESPGRRSARGGASQQSGGERRKADVRKLSDSRELPNTAAVEAAREGDPQPPLESPGRRSAQGASSQQCGGERRKERAEARRSLDSCDLLKRPVVVAAGGWSPQASCGGKERAKKGVLKDKLLKGGEREKGEELKDNFLKGQGILEGASRGKGRTPVVGSSRKAKERETKELTDKLLKEFFEGAPCDIEGTPSGIVGASPGKRRPPIVGSSSARANGRRTIGSLAELRQLEMTEHGERMTQHGRQLTHYERQQRKELVKRGNSGPLRMSPSAHAVRRRNRSMGDDAALFDPTQQAQQSPRRRNRSTELDPAPVTLPKSRLGIAPAALHVMSSASDEEGEKTRAGNRVTHRESSVPSSAGKHADSGRMESLGAVVESPRYESLNAQREADGEGTDEEEEEEEEGDGDEDACRSFQSSRGVSDAGCYGESPPATAVLSAAPRLDQPQCFSPEATPPGRLASSLKALVGRLTFARTRGDGSRGGDRRAGGGSGGGGSGGGGSGGGGSGGGSGSKAGGFKEPPTPTHGLQRDGTVKPRGGKAGGADRTTSRSCSKGPCDPTV